MRLRKEFFERDVLEVAPELLGKYMVRDFGSNISKYLITEIEAYRGEEDKACHVSKGRTARTEIMYGQGGLLYVYLIYGIHWLLNIVTAVNDVPQAILVRAIGEINGPGRVSKLLKIDKSFYGEDVCKSGRIWIEDSKINSKFRTDKRIGIDYAGDYWKNKKWRFILENDL